jgi:hypothetical protein
VNIFESRDRMRLEWVLVKLDWMLGRI